MHHWPMIGCRACCLGCAGGIYRSHALVATSSTTSSAAAGADIPDESQAAEEEEPTVLTSADLDEAQRKARESEYSAFQVLVPPPNRNFDGECLRRLLVVSGASCGDDEKIKSRRPLGRRDDIQPPFAWHVSKSPGMLTIA